MKRLIGRTCATVAVLAALGMAAAPAGAERGLPLEPAREPAAAVLPTGEFAPQSFSAGAYNTFMCYLHTISASVPCMYA